MPTAFQRWCLEQFGRLPTTFTEIMYFGRWYERDRQLAVQAQAELEQISTVDDFLKAAR